MGLEVRCLRNGKCLQLLRRHLIPPPILSTFILSGCMFALSSGFALAQVPQTGFAGFKHIRWGADEGAPIGVYKMAQTPDGYLWLTGDGLYRFDGVTFEQLRWPEQEAKARLDPMGLMVRRNGELWVGLNGNAGVAVYRKGRLVNMAMPAPPTAIGAMVEAADGTLWFASDRFDGQLRRLRNGRWDPAQTKFGQPPGAVMGLVAAKDGSVWIAVTHADGQDGAVARLPRGADRFQLLSDRVGPLSRLAVDGEGAVWLSDQNGTRMLADGSGKRPAHPVNVPIASGIRSAPFAFDRDGGLWRTSGSSGISYTPKLSGDRSPDAPGYYPFTVRDGLTSDITHAALLDREGSIWIATETGLDQFRRASATQATTIPPDPVNGLAIARATDGGVYIQSSGRVFRIAPGDRPRQVAETGSASMAMCAGRQGGVWIVQHTRTLRLMPGRAEALPAYTGSVPITCAEDRLGRLWVSLDGEPPQWRDHAGWHVATGALGALRPWELTTTRSGDLALHTAPTLSILRGNQLIRSGNSPRMTMMMPSGDDVFASDDHGLIRWRGGRSARLGDARFPWLIWLRGLVQTTRGETWLVARTGIYRVATADLERAFEDRRAVLPYRRFDIRDGLTSVAQHAGFKGLQIAEGGDGRVWFLNREGAAYFEPAKLAPNPLPPPVSIAALSSGGVRWRDPVGLVLPAGTRAIDISYAGLSFIVPQRMHFRYRLEGIDTDWVDAGGRRLASYTNLSPGRYRFRVIAANADGVWNRTGAALDFEIRPTFWQSTPFKLLCAIGLLGLLWAAYAMRLRVVAARIRLRMTERFDERERIARELHDTLLQGIQAVTLRFQRVINELPDQQPARGTLLQALDVADKVIAEGRDRVQDLRGRQFDALEPLLRDLFHRQLFEPNVQLAILETGRRRQIEPLALDEVVRIAGEALANVRKHAEARHVRILIAYRSRLSLSIADDGIGIDLSVAKTGRAGHFGLHGMRERAHKLRATLAIHPCAGHGTEVVLTVPGRIAYLPERPTWWTRTRRVR
ncbi:signal transduction histidine kinase [Sphingomonas trueperi]|uniref:sensor histidine kinase n=1 Tax=Sphingomonas trueperi TaxID=53317 RepID=UPI0033910949